MPVIYWAIGTLLSAFVGSFLAAYLSEKGKNLATREDVDNLVEQMSMVTKATKEIEARISGDLWDRQKRWELKREILFDAIRRLADLEEGLIALDSVVQVEKEKNKKDDELGWLESKLKETMKWSRASAAFDESFLFVQTLCDQETIKAFFDLNAPIKLIAQRLIRDKDAGIFKSSIPQRLALHNRVQSAIRNELVNTALAPQPGGSPTLTSEKARR